MSACFTHTCKVTISVQGERIREQMSALLLECVPCGEGKGGGLRDNV